MARPEIETTLVAASCLAAALVGCSTDSSSKPYDPGPTKGSIHIDAVVPAGGRAWHRSDATRCVELGSDPDGVVGVALTALGPKQANGTHFDWTFRGPFGCGNSATCGYVRVSVDGSTKHPIEATAAAPFVGVRLGARAAGTHTFRAELRAPDGAIAAGLDGGVASDEVTVELRRSCEGDAGGTDAGVDAAPDARIDARSDAPNDAPPDRGSSDAAPDTPRADGAADSGADRTSDAPADGGVGAPDTGPDSLADVMGG